MEKPPKKIRVLTRLKISEVSAVDRRAGENCRVVLSKRDGNYNPEPLSNSEKAKAMLEGRAALRHAEEQAKREQDECDDRSGPLFDKFHKIFSNKKSYAAVARGDETDMTDEETPADELAGDDSDDDSDADETNKSDDGEHHASKVANLLVESGKHPDRASALDHLLHTSRGQALLRRMRKSHEDQPMSITSEQKLRDIAKQNGVHVIAKMMVADQRSYGVGQDELVDLISNHERQPGESAAKCFARHYEADTADGLALRKAVEITKNAPLQDDAVAKAEEEAAAACRELAKIGADRWPNLSVAQRFARAAETHPELLRKAHRRPSPFTGMFPFPR